MRPVLTRRQRAVRRKLKKELVRDSRLTDQEVKRRLDAAVLEARRR